eukprot:764770-Hanusia_phi.AAC.1
MARPSRPTQRLPLAALSNLLAILRLAILRLAILLSPSLTPTSLAQPQPQPDTTTVRNFTVDFPGCRCSVNKPVQFVQYMSDSAIRSRLLKWDAEVRRVGLGKWSSARTPQNLTTFPGGHTPLCRSDLTFTRTVDFELPVTPPLFLKPFVGDMLARQHKRQGIVDCHGVPAFYVSEDIIITNLPVLSSISVMVRTPVINAGSPSAYITITHANLP